jgi:hypothetical protein
MSCKNCKYFQFNQNDMMGLCKLYPTVVNKLPQDWCGQEIPKEYEPTVKDWQDASKSITLTVAPKATIVAQETTYDINTDAVKPKRGRKPNAGKQKRIEPLV